VELDREARESIQGTEREIHRRTSVNSTRFRQKSGIVHTRSESPQDRLKDV